jgi:SAM-dependent methyltransferase
LGLNPALLSVRYDHTSSLFFVQNSVRERINVTSSRDALNGYQKGKCFYCFRQISIVPGNPTLADVDHFLPHTLRTRAEIEDNLNGVWNLVLACRECNRGEKGKAARVPRLKYLERLHDRNNYLIASHHPLRDTLMLQTGATESSRRNFLQEQYAKAKSLLVHDLAPVDEQELRFMSGTIEYYDRNAEQFFRETANLDMSALFSAFLPQIPPGGKLLDAGCGSGRDSYYFLQHGYHIEAFDASSEMCRLASGLIGQTVQQKNFEEIDWVSACDGIWACASLLHVRRDSMDVVLQKLCLALKPGGVMFVCFKLRDEEWEQDGRFFNGYDEGSFQELLGRHPTLACHSIWVTDDTRLKRKGQKWLNALLQRASH